jgi:hypothetical protein
MGRKSKQWTEEDRPALDNLTRSMLSLDNNEKATTLMLKLFLTFDDLHLVLGVARIARHRFEFDVGGGRIDLLLFHVDGGVTIVEAKAESDTRTIIGGIGQLCFYAAKLPKLLTHTAKPKYVNMILAAPIKPEKSLSIMDACNIAGVRFVHLAPYSVLKASIDKAKETWLRYG